MQNKKILIVGGGFGGIKAALELSKHDQFEVTLLSDRDDFRFYPALFETASGRSSQASSIPLTEIFKGKRVKLAKGSVTTLNRDQKTLQATNKQTYSYDVLVLALGVITNFFGIKGLDKYAYGIKSLDEAKRLRQHIHQLVVDNESNEYVIVGGGPTGIELAGVLPAYIKHVAKQHKLALQPHIDLVEAAPHLLPRMRKSFSKKVEKQLRRLGIKLYLGQAVQAETAEALQVSGHSIKSHCVVWTAGVTNHPFLKQNNFNLSDHGKALVDQYLSAEPNIYIIGDNANTPYSGMAQTALYDGKFVASNLVRIARGKNPKAYKPKQPIYVMPAGPHWAAVQWRHLAFYGKIGWLLRNAADWVAYHDYEPFWLASKHWVAEHTGENECEICR